MLHGMCLALKSMNLDMFTREEILEQVRHLSTDFLALGLNAAFSPRTILFLDGIR